MTAIDLDRVSVAYDATTVLTGVSIGIPHGTWLGVVGPNGAGKSTMLRAIAGLVDATGSIRIDGTPVNELDRRQLAQRVAYVPQQPAVPVSTTVVEYVLLGRTPYISYFGVETADDIEIATQAISSLDLVRLEQRELGSLSGGELQRVILARAIAQQASTLLLDEPTTALDVGHQQQVLELVDALRLERELTVISCMHDLTLAAQYADSLVLLDAGVAARRGPPDEVLTEDAIRAHFGADVRVTRDPDGGLAVLPIRAAAARSKEQVLR